MKMEIKLLPKSLRNAISSEINIRSISKCVAQLIFNSIEANATSVAIRINTTTYRIQVIDNGCGIKKRCLKLIGQRFATSKYHSIDDLEKKFKFPNRGEALASIIRISKSVKIVTSTKNSSKTFLKQFEDHCSNGICAVKTRPSKGTTITIENFMYNIPVRQKQINSKNCIDDIRNEVERIALIHPHVSFSLRDDNCDKIIFNVYRTKFVFQSLSFLYGKKFSRTLRKIRHKSNTVSINGLMSLVLHHRSELQFIYINNKYVTKTKIYSLVNTLIERSNISTNKDSQNDLPLKTKYAAFILNIKCPFSELDILDYVEPTIAFKNKEHIFSEVKNAVNQFLQKHNLINSKKRKKENIMKGSPLLENLPKIRASQVSGLIRGVTVNRKINDENKLKDYILHPVEKIEDSSLILCKSSPEAINSNFNAVENSCANFSKIIVKEKNTTNINKESLTNLKQVDTVKFDKSMTSELGKNLLMEMFLKSSAVYGNECQSPENNDKAHNFELISKITSASNFTKIELMKTVKRKIDYYDNESNFRVHKCSKKRKHFVNSNEMAPTFQIFNNFRKNYETHNQEMKPKSNKYTSITCRKQKYIKSSDFLRPAVDFLQNTFVENNNIPQKLDNVFYMNSMVKNFFDFKIPKNYSFHQIKKQKLRCEPHRHSQSIFNTFKYDTKAQLKRFQAKNHQSIKENLNICQNTRVKSDCLFFENRHIQNKLKSQTSFNSHECNKIHLRKCVKSIDSLQFISHSYLKTKNKNCITKNVQNNFSKTKNKFTDLKFEESVKNKRNLEFLFPLGKIRKNNDEIAMDKYSKSEIEFDKFKWCQDKFTDLKFEESVKNKRNLEFLFPLEKIRKNNDEIAMDKYSKSRKKFDKFKWCQNNFSFDNTGNLEIINNESTFDAASLHYLQDNELNAYYHTTLNSSANEKSSANKDNDLQKHYQESFIIDSKNTDGLLTFPSYKNIQQNKHSFEISMPNHNCNNNIFNNSSFNTKGNVSEFSKQGHNFSISDCINNDNSINISLSRSFENETFTKNDVEMKDYDEINETISSSFFYDSQSDLNGKINMKNKSLHESKNESAEKIIAKYNSIYNINDEWESKISSCKFNENNNDKFYNFEKIFKWIKNNRKFKKTFSSNSNSKENYQYSNESIYHSNNNNTASQVGDSILKNFCEKYETPKMIQPLNKTIQSDIIHEINGTVKSFSKSNSILSTFSIDDINNDTNISFKNESINNSLGEENDFNKIYSYYLNEVDETNLINTTTDQNFTNEFDIKNKECEKSNKSVMENDNDNLEYEILNNDEDQLTKELFNSGSHEMLPMSEINVEDGNTKEWIEIQNASDTGKTYFLNLRTGMTSCFSPKVTENYVMTKRLSFVPKGLSPIMKKTESANIPLSTTSKSALHQTIATVENDELRTIKWMNYFENENKDAKEFFEDLYFDTETYGCETLNLDDFKFPKKMKTAFENFMFTKDDLKNIVIINQWDNKLIITKIIMENNRNLLVVFDQHAVHERIKFEKLLKEYEISYGKLKSMKCQQPVRLVLNDTEVRMLKNYTDNFNNWGLLYNINEEFVSFQQIPLCWKRKHDTDVLNKNFSMIENLILTLIQEKSSWIKKHQTMNNTLPLAITNAIKTEACKTAIKFGTSLTVEQCEIIMKELSECDFPFNCAHGRPTLYPIIDLIHLYNINSKDEENIDFHKLKATL